VRSLRCLVVGLLCAALLAGCRLDAGVAISVDRDGAGTVALQLVADPELAARAEEAGVDPFAPLTEVQAPGWTVTAEDRDDGGRTVVARARFDDPDELASLTADLAAAVNAPEAQLLEPFAVDLTSDTVTVSGGAALVPTAVVAELGLTPEEALALLADSVDYRVRVSLPGEVVEAPAGSIEERTVTWQVQPGERVTVQVVAERPPPWWLWPAVVGGAAVVLLVVALALWWGRRRPRGAHVARG